MPARCILCDRLLMGVPPPSVAAVTNPDALVLCVVCEALSAVERRQRRGQIMMRMLDDATRHRRQHHG
jgi:hypothetical protein